jgi:hypothetical protein
MRPGTYISGAGHLAILGWAVISGPLFDRSDPSPLTASDVSVISLAEFEALSSPVPNVAEDIALVGQPSIDGAEIETPTAETVPNQSSIEPPFVPDDPQPLPDLESLQNPPTAVVLFDAPDLPPIPEASPSGFDGAIATPGIDTLNASTAPQSPTLQEPTQAPVLRVDTTPAPRPDEAVEIADNDSSATTAAEAATEVDLQAEETARAEASTQVATEANRADETTAPQRSIRPRGRPAQRTSVVAAQSEVDTASEIERALAQAAEEADATQSARNAPAGPALTGSEKDGLRLSVQKCWNVASLSSEALNTTVTLSVAMAEDGKPHNNTIRMVEFTGGTEGSANIAYGAARRAIIRCGASGFDLPKSKYAHWQTIEMVFNPEKMRIK